MLAAVNDDTEEFKVFYFITTYLYFGPGHKTFRAVSSLTV